MVVRYLLSGFIRPQYKQISSQRLNDNTVKITTPGELFTNAPSVTFEHLTVIICYACV